VQGSDLGVILVDHPIHAIQDGFDEIIKIGSFGMPKTA
jgi:hypothetical protein